MSRMLDGYDTGSLLACIAERMDGIRALCDVVLDRDDAGDDARELAESVLCEFEGGDAR